MGAIIFALVAGALALATGAERESAKTSDKGPDGKPAKPKTPQEIFADGEKAGRAAEKAAWEAKLAEEKRIRAMVRREARYSAPRASRAAGEELDA